MNKKILVAIIIAIISCTTFYVMLGLKLNKSDEIAEYVTKRDMTFVVTNSIALNDKYGTLYLILKDNKGDEFNYKAKPNEYLHFKDRIGDKITLKFSKRDFDGNHKYISFFAKISLIQFLLFIIYVVCFSFIATIFEGNKNGWLYFSIGILTLISMFISFFCWILP